MSYTAPSITASGTTFAQFQSGGASGHLEKLISAQPLTATSAPSASISMAAGGSGHTLPAATYWCVVTETNGYGETTASPVSSSCAVSSAQQLTVTYNTLQTGNTARNCYLSTVGSTGPFYLAASGQTAATTVFAAPLPSNSYAVTPPTINTAGLSYVDANGNTRKKILELIRSAKTGNLEDAYKFLRGVIEEFNSGQPAVFPGTIHRLQQAHAVFAMLDTLCSEMGTLIDANAGTLGSAATGIGGRKTVRTWP